MNKLLAFALTLVLVSCEVNDELLFTPKFKVGVSTMADVEKVLGYPDFKFVGEPIYRYIYTCYFIVTMDGIERIESRERFFVAKFYDSTLTYYGYLYSDEMVDFYKAHPPK